MSDNHDLDTATSASRRDFLRTAAAAAIGTTLAGREIHGAFAQGSDAIRVGLIGCGGRGTGAVADALAGPQGVNLVAMGDVFQDRLDESRAQLRKQHGEKIAVTDDNCFVGFDAYQKVIAGRRELRHPRDAAGLPPACTSRPPSRPASTSSPRSRSPSTARASARCSAADEEAKAQEARHRRRHAAPAPGRLPRDDEAHPRRRHRRRSSRRAATGTRAACGTSPAQAGWSDMEWQLRNWLYFTWLSGDHIVEQHVHNLDVINWAMQAPPGPRGRHGRPAGPHRPRVRPHLRPLRGRVRVPERRARDEHVPPDRRLREQRVRGASSARRARAQVDRLHDQRTRSAWKFGRARHQPVRAGAHRPDRQHPRRQAAQRAARTSPRAR